MLESYLVSRAFQSSCERVCMTLRLEVSKGKRPIDIHEDEDDARSRKLLKLFADRDEDEPRGGMGTYELMPVPDDPRESLEQVDREEDEPRGGMGTYELMPVPDDPREGLEQVDREEDEPRGGMGTYELMPVPDDPQEGLEQVDREEDERPGGMGTYELMPVPDDPQEGLEQVDREEDERPGGMGTYELVPVPDDPRESLEQVDDAGRQSHAGDSSSDELISFIGRDVSINCLVRCSRSDYGSIALLNQSFHSLVRSGELYRLRRLTGFVEHWVYFSCHLLEWEAFDPIRHRWMHLPRMPVNECFIFSDKESLAVGTELLVFGKEVMSLVIYRYSLLTNSWSSGMSMNTPRCLFGSASLGEIAILAGGCDSQGNILKSAELYNSETQTFKRLPDMHKPRKMCSGVFMDKKFYVIGGIGGADSKVLSCGEEYDLDTETWTEIPNMSPGRSTAARENDMPATAEAPPLVAVVNNELYAADYSDMEVKKYDKKRRVWFSVGRLPDRAVSMNGWGLAFRACGDRLIVIGGPRTMGEGFIEINSWVPGEGPAQWNLLAGNSSRTGNFVYNCAVMGC